MFLVSKDNDRYVAELINSLTSKKNLKQKSKKIHNEVY